MKRDHTKLICDIGELSGIFADAPSMQEFLQKIVEMIADHMSSDVCSIYLFYEDTQELVLKATKGLHPDSIDNVKMKPGEGLTGLALKELRPIREGKGKDSPNFRYFPGIGEEKYESFLAVPILRGAVRIGVMVIQSVRRNYFTEEDVQIFRAITSQLANTIETARLFITLNERQRGAAQAAPAKTLKFIKGRSGSEGVALAPVAVVSDDMTKVCDIPLDIAKMYSEDDFHRAVSVTEKQLENLQKQIEETLFDVASLIFNAQILMLKDKGFNDAIVTLIRAGINPPHAIQQVVREYVTKFNAITDAYLREKVHDVKDVGRRLLENLIGRTLAETEFEGRIVIARELLPSDALKLFSQHVKGIILLSGGVTSHLSILAQSLQIPLVICEQPELLNLAPATEVLLDAVMGHVHIRPTKNIIADIRERDEVKKKISSAKALVSAEPKTKDGTAVVVQANISLLGDLKAAREFRAQGVGLYRTEFPFMVRSDFPTEEEQYLVYRKLVEGMPDAEITFRTLDIGGDKVLSYYDYGKEENPFLGLRSIRFSLRHKDIFAQQIRAILRAGYQANIRIMFPMISSVDEWHEARGVVRDCLKTLAQEKVPFNRRPQLGIMIELPAAMEIIDDLAREADFFSLGTNDLIQYALAVDRTNEKVADLYLPGHPTILRYLKKAVTTSREHGKDLSICGDMAHDPKYLPYLIGIGLRKLSVGVGYLPKVHQALAQIHVNDAEKLAQRLLNQKTVRQVAQLLESKS